MKHMKQKQQLWETYIQPRHPGDFEGWQYQFGHDLALMIDNTASIQKRAFALVREIAGRKHGSHNRMVIEFTRRWYVWLARPIQNEYGPGAVVGGMPMEGWAELFDHFATKVAEIDRHETERSV